MLKTGLTSRTVQTLQLNAGVLLNTEYTAGMALSETNIVCATRGGGSLTIVPEVHQVPIDGAPTYTKGLERVDGWTATFNATAVEFNPKTLKMALGFGAQATNEAGAETEDSVITAHTSAHDTDYNDYWWVGDLADGRYISVHLKNAVNTAGLNMTINDKGEGTFPIALIAHYSVTDIVAGKCDAPFEIKILKKSEAV